ncbi:hypothetical protein [Humibacillus sp. DSM 29435]|uniref:hypothetical protein n=1 Tax=Humibacillus sp. DSM 29435 TaxID=1869167 RepID=UPI000AC1A904|nr:hypothetical protein [Humibacillus sp. DSM 29435]
MRSVRSALAAPALVTLVGAMVAMAPTSASARPAPGVTPGSRPGALTEVRVGTPLSVPSIVPAADASGQASRNRVNAATFTVTYRGFTPAAKAAFQRAVNIWSQQLSSPVPITVSASFEPLGPGVLGAAGPTNLWRDFAGAPLKGTWYADAIANKRSGSQLSPTADITARFSSSFSNWHYGTGAVPAGKYDFTSVVLHELGHGVGFLGVGNVSGSAGSVRLGGYPFSYDRYTETGAGTSLLSLADNSTALGSALRSNSVYFDTAKVRAANANRPARLYAPSTFQGGSSYSHLDEATYRAGNANSLMTPAIGSGETIRNPGPIAKAMLTSIGW